jgi:hypothetical protein
MDTVEQPDKPATPDRPAGATRRGGFGTGLKLAVAAPAALAALPAGAALADSDRKWWDDEDDWNVWGVWAPGWWGRVLARGRLEQAREQLRQLGRIGQTSTAFSLHRVADVPDGDFDRGNQGGDPLDGGALFVVRAGGDHAGRVVVMLGDAAQRATYEVHFVRFKDKGRELVGQVTTNGSGDFSGLVTAGGSPARLSGSRRVGLFVLTRDGKDQFVSTLSTEA